MELRSRKEENICIVTVTGRLDAVSAPEFEKSCMQWIEGGEASFIFDMAGLEYISSAGLRSLLLIAKKLKAGGGGISFSSLRPDVAHVFSISNFQSIFALHDSVENAIQSRRGTN